MKNQNQVKGSKMKKKTTSKQYTKNLQGRVNFRASPAMMDYLRARSEKLGETPSSLARAIILQQMTAENLLREACAPTPSK